jgi:hypothetical protein
MTVYRVLLAVAIVGITMHQAGAQFGGMPGMPGGPGFGGFQPAVPPQCQELLGLRDAVQKHGIALQTASKRKASPKEACRLLKNFVGAEAKMMKAIEKNGASCGVPGDVLPKMRDGHTKVSAFAKQVCEAAAQPQRPPGPSLSEALGTSTPIPETKKGIGTFDTLTGNPLAR